MICHEENYISRHVVGDGIWEDSRASVSLTSSRSGPILKRMEVASGPAAPEPGEIRALKQCLLRRNKSREQHGVAASCLKELRNKGRHGTGARAWGAGARAEGSQGQGEDVRRG